MAQTNTFQKAVNMAMKPGTYLAIVHKNDGNAEFKVLKQDMYVPERLTELQQKNKISVVTRDSQIFIMPRHDKIEYIQNSSIRVIHYIEGFTQAVTPYEAHQFYRLLRIVEKHKIVKGLSLPIVLFNILDKDMSDIKLESVLNFQFDPNDGFSVDYTLDDVQLFIKLRKELIENHFDIYTACKQTVLQMQEEASINRQNLVDRYRYLEAEKAGKGVLGAIFADNKFTTLILVIFMVIAMVIGRL